MKVMFFDPGSHRTGYAILEVTGGKEKILEYGTYDRKADGDEKAMAALMSWACLLLEKWRPDAAGMELVFFGRNTLNARRTSEARGALMVALGRWGGGRINVHHLTPPSIKKGATGDGSADKKKVKRCMEARFNVVLEGPDDGHDALAGACVAAAFESANKNGLG